MFRLAIITVLGLLGSEAYESQSPRFQVLAVIPHGRSPPLVDLTDPSNVPYMAQDDMSVASSQHYPSFEDYDDFRPKRDSDEQHPDAYLRPPSEDASTPLWQDGNNWDLGYDPSEILSPPMPLSMGIPYDTIKLSTDDSSVLEVNEAQGSSPQRQESRPSKPRQQKPRTYKKRPSPTQPQSFSPPAPQRFSDYDEKPSPKRPNRFTDYEDVPVRPNKRQTYNRGGYQDSYSDYDEPPRQQAAFSFAQTDQNGHYKWGVRHHQ